MVYTPHTVIKPEKIVATQLAYLEQNSVLARAAFTRESIDRFKQVKNDTLTMTVPGRLPAREYEFRNDRSTEVQFDVYSERAITLTIGGHLTSGVRITDEQKDFDGVSENSLVALQGRAIGEALEDKCRVAIEGAPFPALIGGVQHDIRRGVLEARRVLNKLRQPDRSRLLIVGSDFEAEMLNDKDIVFASSSGDSIANSALTEASLGRFAGFTVIRDDSIESESAYAMSGNAFLLATGAPVVPTSAGFGATISHDGFAMTWVRDYAIKTVEDLSLVHLWYGTNIVKDVFINYAKPSPANNPVGSEVVGTSEHFVRAVKLTLGGTDSVGPVAGSPLALDSGLVDGDLWVGVAPV